jgi:hypothetical protein
MLYLRTLKVSFTHIEFNKAISLSNYFTCAQVLEGVDNLLFNLLVLGSITDRTGHVWTRLPSDLYVIETMPLMQREANRSAVCLILAVSILHAVQWVN